MAELAKPDKFRFALLCMGARGDVQPLVLLGRQLQVIGHTVLALVPANLVDFCSRRGVDARAVYVDLEAVMRKAPTVDQMAAECAMWKVINRDLFWGDPLDALLEFKPDLVVWNTWNSERDAGLVAYERLYPVPTVLVHTSFYNRGGAVDLQFDMLPRRPTFIATSPWLKGRQTLRIEQAGKTEYNGVYNCVAPDVYMHESSSDLRCWCIGGKWFIGCSATNGGRATYFATGSDPLPPERGWQSLPNGDGVGTSMPVPEHLGPKVEPVTLPPHVHWTGAWLPSDDCRPSELVEADLPSPVAKELLAFIREGPEPIAIGFGSVIGFAGGGEASPRRLLLLVLRALLLCGRRAVVLGGAMRLQDVDIAGLADGPDKAGGAGAKELAELAVFARANCVFVAAAPHQWLLPRCSCNVHHGGTGTLQASLHAGKPSVVIPQAGDQHHVADAVNFLGLGVGLLQKEVTPEELARAIARAENMTPVVREMGERLRAEGGNAAAKAAGVLHGFMRHEARGWVSASRAIPAGQNGSICSWEVQDCRIA